MMRHGGEVCVKHGETSAASIKSAAATQDIHWLVRAAGQRAGRVDGERVDLVHCAAAVGPCERAEQWTGSAFRESVLSSTSSSSTAPARHDSIRAPTCEVDGHRRHRRRLAQRLGRPNAAVAVLVPLELRGQVELALGQVGLDEAEGGRLRAPAGADEGAVLESGAEDSSVPREVDGGTGVEVLRNGDRRVVTRRGQAAAGGRVELQVDELGAGREAEIELGVRQRTGPAEARADLSS